ncbi:DUF6318 family protein [Cellulomonas aerilata]|uniref:DUF6318 domain-containing protein n=1 Tax=Cellulomonas aerilata TaxID=515326 RepID=A0A512D8J9_9CELL|nr:DUF6318 family protein [Cellulomonas aerilata]GEO32808.1 hypothetical protein CAE01nite_05330 [Cellulomonas aerilata]
MHLSRRIAAGALVVVGALALAGCTGGEPDAQAPTTSGRGTVSPSPSASPTPSPTATATPPASPPPPPADLARTDEVGAAAAATYFLTLYAYTMQTGDVSAWDAMSSPGCGFCSRTRDFALGVSAAGETFTGTDISVSSTFVYPLDPLLEAYPVDATFTQAAGEHRNAQGELLSTSPPDSGTFGVDVTRVSGGWKVLAVTAQDD